MTLEQLSEYLGLKSSYIYKLVHQNKLTYYKPFGKKLYFRKSEVDAMIENSREMAVKSPAEIKDLANQFMLNEGRR